MPVRPANSGLVLQIFFGLRLGRRRGSVFCKNWTEKHILEDAFSIDGGTFFDRNHRVDETANAAEQFFRDRIPLTRAMGLRVLPSANGGFVVEAPVALNSNHLGTGFGGSIHAVALLAGYGLLWTELRDVGADIVVRESSIRFLHPVRIVIHAACARPPGEEMRRLREQLLAKGKSRIDLTVRVKEENRVAAELHGTFVAVRRS